MSKKVWKTFSPIRLRMGKKMYGLNLNIFRNLHYRQLNKLKQLYGEVMKEFILHSPKFKTCRITYTVFKGDRRKFDIANVCSVVDKFFCDAMVELGKLPDDNANVIDQVVYKYGGIDKGYPRVEIQVEGERDVR